MTQRSKPKTSTLWIISEVYYPEETSTGHYMTLIAEGMAQKRGVKVICARPNYSQRGIAAPPREIRNGVEIFRCWSTTLDKNRALFRLVNLLTVSSSIFCAALRRIRAGDVVLVGTNPPALPFVIAFVCWLCRAPCILKIEDVYPDNMIAAGMVARQGLVSTLIEVPHRVLYRRMAAISVLGRDMALRVRCKTRPSNARIECIPNWADVELVRPQLGSDNSILVEHGLQNRFVVGYAGNIGPLQGIKDLFLCTQLLSDHLDVHFLFVGSGKMVGWLARAVAEAKLSNVTILGQRPRSDQENFLNACDIGIVSLISGMSGVGVPSRTYNVLAAGKPILAFLEPDSEIGMMVREENVGWVVAPGDTDGFVKAVLAAKSNLEEVAMMGRRARHVAETKYSYQTVMDQYHRLFARL